MDDLAAIAEAVGKGQCILFLGAGVHYGPPAGADPKYLDAYPEARRPPLGRALSVERPAPLRALRDTGCLVFRAGALRDDQENADASMIQLPKLAWPREPYRGIEQFRFIDRPIFFERRDEIRRLIRLVSIYRREPGKIRRG